MVGTVLYGRKYKLFNFIMGKNIKQAIQESLKGLRANLLAGISHLAEELNQFKDEIVSGNEVIVDFDPVFDDDGALLVNETTVTVKYTEDDGLIYEEERELEKVSIPLLISIYEALSGEKLTL